MNFSESLHSAQLASLNYAIEQRNAHCDLLATEPYLSESHYSQDEDAGLFFDDADDLGQ